MEKGKCDFFKKGGIEPDLILLADPELLSRLLPLCNMDNKRVNIN